MGMAWPIVLVTTHLYLEEVAVHAGHEVLIIADDNSVLLVGDQQGILGQQPRPQSIHLSFMNGVSKTNILK
jgi:hypothetical protein